MTAWSSRSRCQVLDWLGGWSARATANVVGNDDVDNDDDDDIDGAASHRGDGAAKEPCGIGAIVPFVLVDDERDVGNAGFALGCPIEPIRARALARVEESLGGLLA